MLSQRQAWETEQALFWCLWDPAWASPACRGAGANGGNVEKTQAEVEFEAKDTHKGFPPHVDYTSQIECDFLAGWHEWVIILHL